MLAETLTIIRSAMKLDHTMSEAERRDALTRVQNADAKPRRRIMVVEARRILGISQPTWSRKLANDPAYRKLALIRDGTRVFVYQDEIEAVRDGNFLSQPK